MRIHYIPREVQPMQAFLFEGPESLSDFREWTAEQGMILLSAEITERQNGEVLTFSYLSTSGLTVASEADFGQFLVIDPNRGYTLLELDASEFASEYVIA